MAWRRAREHAGDPEALGGAPLGVVTHPARGGADPAGCGRMRSGTGRGLGSSPNLPRAPHEPHAPHRGRAPRSARTATGPLLRRDVHFALENDGWNCTFECEMHVSASGSAHRGPRPQGEEAAKAAPSHRGRHPAARTYLARRSRGPDRGGLGWGGDPGRARDDPGLLTADSRAGAVGFRAGTRRRTAPPTRPRAEAPRESPSR